MSDTSCASLDQLYAAPEEIASIEVSRLAAVLDNDDDRRAAELVRTVDDIPPVELMFTYDVENIRDYDEIARIHAAYRLRLFAERWPAIVAAHASTLVAQLQTPNTTVRHHVAHTVSHASSTPEPFIDYAFKLISPLNDDVLCVRRAAVHTLAEIAEMSPMSVVHVANALIPLLDAENVIVQNDAVNALSEIAYALPTAVIPAADSLISFLVDGNTSVMWCIHYGGSLRIHRAKRCPPSIHSSRYLTAMIHESNRMH